MKNGGAAESMRHLPVHDIARVALDATRDTHGLLIDRLTPGGGFMSYAPVQDCFRALLAGSINLEQAIRWVMHRKDRRFVTNNYIENLKLLESWRKQRIGQFISLKDRPLVFSRTGKRLETSNVGMSGIWITPKGPFILWLFPRKSEALIGTEEFGFTCSAMRKVFPDQDLKNLPIEILDLRADINGVRQLTSHNSLALPAYSDRQMDIIFRRYIRARQDVESIVAAAQKRGKQRPDPNQPSFI